MSTLSRTLIVQTSKAQTWNVLKDFGGVYRWHLKVETSPLLSKNNEGLGAKRVCNFYDGSSVAEEIIEYQDGESFKVELSDFSMPLSRANATIQLKELGPQKTEVTITMDYDMKYGPIGWAMNKVMLQPMMGKMFLQVLEGLKHHTITGDIIDENGAPNQQRVAA